MREIDVYTCGCGKRNPFFYKMRCHTCHEIVERHVEVTDEPEKINWWTAIPALILFGIFILSKIGILIRYEHTKAIQQMLGGN